VRGVVILFYLTYVIVLCKLCALHTYIRIKLDDLVVPLYENSFVDYKILLLTDLLAQGFVFKIRHERKSTDDGIVRPDFTVNLDNPVPRPRLSSEHLV